MSDTGSSGAPRSAEEIFADYLGQLADCEAPDFDELCASHVDAAPELRKLAGAFGEAAQAMPGDVLDPTLLGPRSAARPAPSPQLSAGLIVGDFRLVAPIGQGGMGQVWLAQQLSLGDRKVAIKFVRPDRVTPQQLEYFAREARAGGRLHHPGIVTVFASGESDGLQWIAMEHVEGEWTLRDSLDELARTGDLPREYDRTVARCVAAIADALQAAHDAGVIHRDLKPQNVLVTRKDEPKVMDFGLARITDETAISQTGDFAGTYSYMSPEQVAARRIGIDHRTDVFSLGAVLYEMLTLRRPFDGDTTHQIAAKILYHEPPAPREVRSRVPTDLGVIAGKAMEKRPEQRYPSMREFAADLRRHLADEPIHARPPSISNRANKWVRRHPTRSAVLAVSGLALTALAGLGVAYVTKAVQAAERGRGVRRLSMTQDLDALLAQVDALWPPHADQVEPLEAWLLEADRLIASVEGSTGEAGLRHQLEELERLGALDTGWEAGGHPDYAELRELHSEVTALRRADQVRAGAAEVDRVELERDDEPSVETLWRAARARAGQDRIRFGEEALGLAQAERALELAPEFGLPAHVRALEIHAWALFANGLDDAAMDQALAALELCDEPGQEQRSAQVSESLLALESAISGAPEELIEAENRLGAAELALEADRPRAFADPLDGWWHARLRELVGGVRDTAADLLGEASISPRHGWTIRRRLDCARRLQTEHAPGGEFAANWKVELPKIRAAYDGLELAPQMGLVPIGSDPASHLWEFWHVPSGERPERGEDGRLLLTAESGLVFVLLPGGRFQMGSQGGDPAAPNHLDPREFTRDQWHPFETPVRAVSVSPFFLAKDELTQAQWQRWTGQNPSHYHPALQKLEITTLHPVEQISWEAAVKVLARYDLILPSEAQWEYACRAGSTTPFSFGTSADEPARYMNLHDLSHQRDFHSPSSEPWDDGYPVHAPIGCFEANGFGLRDMLGNVNEWCLDDHHMDAYAILDGGELDPVAELAGVDARVARGGSWLTRLQHTRSGVRFSRNRYSADASTGIRPARAIQDP